MYSNKDTTTNYNQAKQFELQSSFGTTNLKPYAYSALVNNFRKIVKSNC